jgi:hypothetical protein
MPAVGVKKSGSMSDVDPAAPATGQPTPELAVLGWPSRFAVAGERAAPLERARQVTTTLYHEAAEHGHEGPPAYDKKWVAERALAVALLTLRDEGWVTMEVVTKKVLMVHRTHVMVSRAGGSGQAGGLGGQLLTVLQKPESVSDLVYRWFGEEVPSPAGHVVWVIEFLASQRGYYRVVTREGIINRALRGKTSMEPVTERMSAVEPFAHTVADRWQTLARDEPELHRELLADVKRALGRRVEASDGPD